MKKTILALGTLVLALSLAACSTNETTNTKSKPTTTTHTEKQSLKGIVVDKSEQHPQKTTQSSKNQSEEGK